MLVSEMRLLPAALALVLLAVAPASAGGGPENVLVVVNDLSEESVQIARYYIARRDIPRHHVVHVKIPSAPPADPKKPEPYRTPDAMPGDYDGYVKSLETPVKTWLAANPASKITTIVLTRGIPVVTKCLGKAGGFDQRSTAHLLAVHACADEKWKTGQGETKSPIHRTDKTLDPADPSAEGCPIYAVGMLNAFGVEDVKRMVDLAIQADAKRPVGTVYLGESADKDPRGMYSPNFPKLVELLKGWNIPAVIVPNSGKPQLLEGKTDVLFYQFGAANWDPKFPALNKYVPGCVVDNLTSFGLVPAQFYSTTTGGQTPVPHFLAAGATAVHGCVAEPYTAAWDSEQYYIRKYFEGYNVLESYYMGHPWMPWMNLVCGDPLLQPFAQRPLVAQEAFEKLAAVDGQKPAYRLKVAAKPGREETKIAKLVLYVDGVKSAELDGDAPGEFTLPDFDPELHEWTVVAIDDSKFRTQGFLHGPPIKKDASKIKATLDKTTKTTMKVKLSYDGKEPVVTWIAPGSKTPIVTKRGREFTATWEKEGPHSIEGWVRSAKGNEPVSFYFEAPAK